jgi:hypothetical protein
MCDGRKQECVRALRAVPPTKSLIPQEKTAAKLKLVGVDSEGSVIGCSEFRSKRD